MLELFSLASPAAACQRSGGPEMVSKPQVSRRVLRLDELDLFRDFVAENYSVDHSYVRSPELLRHFFEDESGLNIYGAFLQDELVGVWPFLYYNIGRKHAAGCLFLFKPVEGVPFLGQASMKLFLEDLKVEAFFTAGIIERLLPFYRRVGHVCSQYKQFYWRPEYWESDERIGAGGQIKKIDPNDETFLNDLKQDFPQSDFLPEKDFWYFKKTYIENLSQKFETFSGFTLGRRILFATAIYSTPIGKILRLYDYFGNLIDFPIVLSFLKNKAMVEECRHVDVMVSGMDDEVFLHAGFRFLDPDQSEVIVPNNFFPFEEKNSKVFCGIRMNVSGSEEKPVVLFKGAGDQIVPRHIHGWALENRAG